jgi:hypothetical protein
LRVGSEEHSEAVEDLSKQGIYLAINMSYIMHVGELYNISETCNKCL